MSSCPTIRIAMFGSRSTGKTTFLSSFVSGRSEQGCSLNVSNELDRGTQNYLRGLWQQLLEGRVANATAMTFTNNLLFNFRYQVQGKKKDEWSWNLVFRDYAGKLVEWDIPSDATPHEEDKPAEKIEVDIKKDLEEYMKQADAFMFLVPVDIPEWNPSIQQLYIAYINDVINIAKEVREDYSRSIPFCIALMKWDLTDMVVPPTKINPDSTYIFPTEVGQYFSKYQIFGEIYDTISRQTNDTVPIFATSVFGSHLTEKKGEPIKGQVKPYNTLPILHWMCTKVEQVRWNLLEREIETLTSKVDSLEKFEQISNVYDEFLARGVNDSVKIEEITQRQKENHKKHIDFKYKEVEEKISAINNDTRCKNKGKEIAIVLKEQLESGLFKADDERRIKHDIEDCQKASKKYVRKQYFQNTCWVTVALIVACFVVYGAFTGLYYSKYVNAISLLGDKPDSVSASDLKDIGDTANMYSLWWEKYNPVVTGMRETIREKYQKIMTARRTEFDNMLVKITDPREKIKAIENMDKVRYPNVIVKENENKIPSLRNEVNYLEIEKQLADHQPKPEDTPNIKIEKYQWCINFVNLLDPKKYAKDVIQKQKEQIPNWECKIVDNQKEIIQIKIKNSLPSQEDSLLIQRAKYQNCIKLVNELTPEKDAPQCVIDEFKKEIPNWQEKIINTKIEEYAIKESDSPEERIRKRTECINLVQKLSTKDAPESIIKSFQNRIPQWESENKLDNEIIVKTKKENEQQILVANLTTTIATIQQNDVQKRLLLISQAEKDYPANKFEPPQTDLFAQLTQLKTETENSLKEEWQNKFNKWEKETLPHQFKTRKEIAENKKKICDDYANYYPEGHSVKTELTEKSVQLQKEIDLITPLYESIESDYDGIQNAMDEQKLKLATSFVEKYSDEATYPNAKNIVLSVSKQIEEIQKTYDTSLLEAITKIEQQYHPENYQFSEQAKLARSKADVYKKYADRFPEGEENPYSSEYNKFDTQATDLSAKSYTDFEKRYNEMTLIAQNNFDKLKIAQELLNYKEQNLIPLAENLLWITLDTVRNDCIDHEWSNYQNELHQVPDNTSDSTDKRQSNLKERQKIYQNYRGKFNELGLTEKVKKISSMEADDSTLDDTLGKYKDFEDSYANVKNSTDIPELESFKTKYSADCYTTKYQPYMEYIDDRIKELQTKSAISILVADCKIFDTNFKAANKTFKKYKEEIKDLQDRWNSFPDAPERNMWSNKLKDFLDENECNWEKDEYGKVQVAETLLHNQPSIENLKSVIDKANSYLSNQDSPKNNSAKIRTQKATYEELYKFLTSQDRQQLQITITSFSVVNSPFNPDIEFTFYTEGANPSVTFANPNGPKNPIRFPLAIYSNKNLSLYLKDLNWGGPDATSRAMDRLYFSKEILNCIPKEKSSFTHSFLFPKNNNNNAYITIEVSGFPPPPKKLQNLQ